MSRILVVDDDDSFREMMRETLERSGYGVQDAPNGRVALELHRQRQSELIIIDLIMPVQEGLQTIAELRRVDPGVKIIAVSGGGFMPPETNLAVAKRLGADLALPKLFLQEEILGAISRLLGR
jgi:two-component system chemotaxis response regulator CheY